MDWLCECESNMFELILIECLRKSDPVRQISVRCIRLLRRLSVEHHAEGQCREELDSPNDAKQGRHRDAPADGPPIWYCTSP